jgi:choline dehydrogenase
MANYDYLVVGGVTAGCVLAARLSENPTTRVALLEAGPAEAPALMSDPTAWFGLWGSTVDWADKAIPQASVSRRGLQADSSDQ